MKGIGIKKYILLLGIFLFLLSVLTNLVIMNLFFKSKRIAVVDFQDIKNSYIKLLMKKPNIDQENYIKDFTKKSNELIIQVSKDNNLIIFPKQAVFYGEDLDLTKQFRSILLNE